MKRCLIVVIICCGLFNRAFGQSASAAIDSLIKYRLIKAKQRSILEEELKKESFASYRVAILAGLEDIWYQKTFHVNPRRATMARYYSLTDSLKSKSQDRINAALRVLLDKINKAGLLSDRVYAHTFNDIDSGRYALDVQMMAGITGLSSRLEWLTPDKLLPVAEQLHKSEVVSDSSFWRLQDDIRAGKIESASQLSAYCKLDSTFDITKYPDDPKLWLEQLHRDVVRILPHLNFTQFSYTETPDSNSSIGRIPAIKYKVTIVCNGYTYKRTSIAYNFGSKSAKMQIYDIVRGGYYRIFNKILADEQSPLRLHDLMFTPGKSVNDHFQHFTLIALRDEQAEILMRSPCFSYMLLSRESYNNTLTTARVDSTIAGWRKIGLFAHLSEAEITKAIDDAESDDLFSMDRLLANFPRVIYRLNSVVMGPDYPYVNLLSHFSGITHGAFNPTRIKERKVKGGVKLQYFFNGRTHSYTFNTAMGWLDAKFPAFIEQLSQKNNLPGNFYMLPDDNAVIYLTKQHYSYVIERKLLDLGTTKSGRRKL